MIFYLNDNDKKVLRKVKRTTLSEHKWNEKDLEDLISNNIEHVISQDNLMTIFNERKGKEEPDILALDKSGTLFILELKRWQSDQSNLLQVLRYGQIFGQYDYEMLNNLFKKQNNGKELIEEHQEYFDLPKEKEMQEKDFNCRQHFLIVTDGTDQDTRQAINYWRSTGLSIDSVLYRTFLTQSGEKLIEFNVYSPDQDEIELESNSFILNTNIKNDPTDDLDMIKNTKAAAFYTPWKYNINKIEKGNKVFLYRSGTGIVAMGMGSGKTEQRDYHGDLTAINEEHYTVLTNFQELKIPLKAYEIKEITGKDYNFMPTMFGIGEDNGNKLWEHILNHCI